MGSASMAASDLARRIYDPSHLTGEFRLRSGVVSSEYFDKYLFESDAALLKEVAEALVDVLPDGVEAVAGLELGGVPLANSGLPAERAPGTVCAQEGQGLRDVSAR